MRTTVTLDPDVADLLRRTMRERNLTFKEAINEALRTALAPPPEPFSTPTFHLGRPHLNLDKALAVAGALEDAAIGDKLELRK